MITKDQLHYLVRCPSNGDQKRTKWIRDLMIEKLGPCPATQLGLKCQHPAEHLGHHNHQDINKFYMSWANEVSEVSA